MNEQAENDKRGIRLKKEDMKQLTTRFQEFNTLIVFEEGNSQRLRRLFPRSDPEGRTGTVRELNFLCLQETILRKLAALT